MTPKIIFMGSSEPGAITLQSLINSNFEVSMVLTRPYPKGAKSRKNIINPVKQLAKQYNLDVTEPHDLKANVMKNLITGSGADLAVVSSYGILIPVDIMDLFKFGCVNIHPSILPKYRGPSPVVAAILNGDSITGVSIMSLDKGMDTGPILAQKEIPITTKYTTPDLTSKLFHIGSELLIETLPKLLNGAIKYQHQNNSKSTYTNFLRKEDGNINWTNPANQIANQIRAYIPWPGTYTYWKGQQLKILSAETDDKFVGDQKPGQVLTSINKNIIPVVTSKGLLLVDKLQMEGKNPLEAKEFLQGYPELIGDNLENSKNLGSKII